MMLRIFKASPGPEEHILFIEEDYTPTMLPVPQEQHRKPLVPQPGLPWTWRNRSWSSLG